MSGTILAAQHSVSTTKCASPTSLGMDHLQAWQLIHYSSFCRRFRLWTQTCWRWLNGRARVRSFYVRARMRDLSAGTLKAHSRSLSTELPRSRWLWWPHGQTQNCQHRPRKTLAASMCRMYWCTAVQMVVGSSHLGSQWFMRHHTHRQPPTAFGHLRQPHITWNQCGRRSAMCFASAAWKSTMRSCLAHGAAMAADWWRKCKSPTCSTRRCLGATTRTRWPTASDGSRSQSRRPLRWIRACLKSFKTGFKTFNRGRCSGVVATVFLKSDPNTVVQRGRCNCFRVFAGCSVACRSVVLTS